MALIRARLQRVGMSDYEAWLGYLQCGGVGDYLVFEAYLYCALRMSPSDQVALRQCVWEAENF